MSDEYTHEDLLDDIEALRKMGLIEIVGINETGQWLWGPTKASLEMTEEERAAAIYASFMEEKDEQ